MELNDFDMNTLKLEIKSIDLFRIGNPSYIHIQEDHSHAGFYIVPIPEKDKEYADMKIPSIVYDPHKPGISSLRIDPAFRPFLRDFGLKQDRRYQVPSEPMPFLLNGEEITALYYSLIDAPYFSEDYDPDLAY